VQCCILLFVFVFENYITLSEALFDGIKKFNILFWLSVNGIFSYHGIELKYLFFFE
jgi:hypothetical protein